MELYFLNWVQLPYDFGKVVPSGTTQGKVCQYSYYSWPRDLANVLLECLQFDICLIITKHKQTMHKYKDSWPKMYLVA
jgi:hypothetical protein